MVPYWIYLIEHMPSGMLYVGQGTRNPFRRWADHFVALRSGRHCNTKMQELWDLTPDLGCWRFQPVQRVLGRRLANTAEADTIRSLPAQKCMNERVFVTEDRRAAVEIMITEGRRYVDIRTETGLSMGMISKIKKEMTTPPQDRFGDF